MGDWEVLSAIGTAASAVIAIWAVVVALNANAQAKASNAIAREALAHQKQIAPPVWSQIHREDEHSFSITNSSGLHVLLERVEAEPESSRADFGFPKFPLRVEYGDSVNFTYWPTLASTSAERLTFHWAFLDNIDEKKTTQRGI